jgi:hypothetical protein
VSLLKIWKKFEGNLYVQVVVKCLMELYISQLHGLNQQDIDWQHGAGVVKRALPTLNPTKRFLYLNTF